MALKSKNLRRILESEKYDVTGEEINYTLKKDSLFAYFIKLCFGEEIRENDMSGKWRRHKSEDKEQRTCGKI